MSADLVHALGNEYNLEILSAAVEPHSAQELSEKMWAHVFGYIKISSCLPLRFVTPQRRHP